MICLTDTHTNTHTSYNYGCAPVKFIVSRLVTCIVELQTVTYHRAAGTGKSPFLLSVISFTSFKILDDQMYKVGLIIGILTVICKLSRVLD